MKLTTIASRPGPRNAPHSSSLTLGLDGSNAYGLPAATAAACEQSAAAAPPPADANTPEKRTTARAEPTPSFVRMPQPLFLTRLDTRTCRPRGQAALPMCGLVPAATSRSASAAPRDT